MWGDALGLQYEVLPYFKKLVCTFLPASPVEEQTGGKKLAGLLSPWQLLVKLLVSREQIAYN
jgi:hypothetical protein